MAHGKGRKDSSKIAGGHYVTLIAKHFDVRLKAKKNPFTLIDDTSVPLSIEMYSAARAVSQEKKKFIPWRPVKGKRKEQGTSSQPPQQQPRNEADVDHLMEDVQTGGARVQYQDQPGWVQDLMGSFSSMRIEQDDRWNQTQQHWQTQDAFQQEFRNEVRYEHASQRYHNAWVAHNTQRLYELEEELEPTPYHAPPMWGQPGAVYPPTFVYDPTAAIADLRAVRDARRDRPWRDEADASEMPQDAPPQHPCVDNWLFGFGPGP